MSSIFIPKLAFIQSKSQQTETFYVVLLDIPVNTADQTYPSAQQLVSTANGQELIFSYPADLPDNYTGETVTYMAGVVEVNSASLYFKKITLRTPNGTNYTGDASGIRTTSLFEVPTPDTVQDFQCAGRCFAIQSPTNTSTYFVGTMVDFPAGQSPLTTSVVDTESAVMVTIQENPSSNHASYLILDYNPVNYTPPSSGLGASAAITSIYIDGHNTPDLTGVLLNEDSNLFESPITPSVLPPSS